MLFPVRTVIWAATNAQHHNHLHVDVDPKASSVPPKTSVRTAAVTTLLGLLTDEFGPTAYFQSEDAADAAWTHMGWYNRRRIAGSTTWSQHAYGNALDIGPYYGENAQRDFYDFLTGPKPQKEEDRMAFTVKQEKVLKDLVASIESVDSSGYFAEGIIADMRKNVVTKDELDAAIRAAVANLDALKGGTVFTAVVK